ncbi:MAG TPA: MFS transporter, partial [Thermoanaerobaculia bacterium]|nr:MFS transporter [Thermoanaerobaculia bacterium]
MKRYFAGLSANTFLLALASLFADISSEMLYPVLPVFLTRGLGARVSLVGLVEGIAQATQNVVQGLSGWLSDRRGERKPIALAGYALGAVAKPLIGLSTGWPGVLGARSLDRLGSGIRSAPRDALVAASVDDASRGKAFGLEGFGDNLGAFVGPLIALGLLGFARVELRSIFFIAFVPGVLAMLMILLVRETPAAVEAKARLDLSPRRFPRSYWMYLGVTAIFGLGNSSTAFLILRATDLGGSLTTTIFLYALVNLTAALASYPAGYLSDRFGRKGMLLVAFLVFFAVYLGFAVAPGAVVVGALFVLYGCHQGIIRAVGKALASDLVPAALRASGVGWYSATIGITGLV